MVVARLGRSKRWVVVAAAAVALLPVAACGSSGAAGNASSETGAGSDRAQAIGRWQDDFCPTVQPELAAKRLSYSKYVTGPSYLAMGHAMSPNTFDCLATFEIDLPKRKHPENADVAIAIYNRNDKAWSSVEEYYQKRLKDWLAVYEELEVGGNEHKVRERDGALKPFLDKELDGPWVAGQAYAIKAAGSYRGSVLAAVRTEDYALFIMIGTPMDPEVSQALTAVEFYEKRGEKPPAELNEQGIESRRVLPFTDEEIAEWTTTEYITAVHEAVEAKLGE
jgi:hypothetical protein